MIGTFDRCERVGLVAGCLLFGSLRGATSQGCPTSNARCNWNRTIPRRRAVTDAGREHRSVSAVSRLQGSSQAVSRRQCFKVTKIGG